MMKLADQWSGQPREYTEVIFGTKGDFQLGFYTSEGKASAFAKSGRIGNATAYLTMATLRKVKEKVDSGLTYLKSR
jgi:hypothetical protein